MQHSLKRPLGIGYDPDIIWTSGMIGKNFLKDCYDNNYTKIENVGSNRFNDFQKTKIKKTKPKKKKQTCLVIPEGYISECLFLFEFSFLYALKHPNLTFI